MPEWWGHLPYEHPDLYAVLTHWPVTIFLPVILLAVVTLATITRISDARRSRARSGS